MHIFINLYFLKNSLNLITINYMTKNIKGECAHFIKRNYYCSKCGALYDKGVNKIF